ncbi:DUF5105 domain-containing protein [Lactobacillus sp. YT155]|uniref:DUF5105 domain-containing protein n=1 Tax=Lactobacillus sp. YT155 TaxID=3060955 RepID=UPI00265DECCF|nr:DUF5105 domain-containing protein [Lactobacillus sp. YT155]MDO1604727.1 DUF5105 domain-containing protein [Lactobacillus sp. YT155]
MKKKLWFTLLLLPLIFVIVGCQKKDDASHSVKGQNVTLEVKSGKFTATDDGDLLALRIKVTNTGTKKLTLNSYDLNLIDNDGNKLRATSYFDDGDLSIEKIAKGEKVQGYVYFKAKKNTKYTLKYDSLSEDKNKANTVKIDTKKYKNVTAGLKEAADAYVNTVILGKDDPNYSKYISTNKDDDKKEFKDAMKDDINSHFFIDSADDATVTTLTDKIQKFNAANAELKAKVTIDDGEPVVQLEGRLIDLGKFDDDYETLQEQKEDEAEAKEDYDTDTYEVAAKEMVGKVDSYLTTDNMKKGDYIKIKFVKDGKKWKVDTDDDDFDSLVSTFSGDVY